MSPGLVDVPCTLHWEDANSFQSDTYLDIDAVYEKWLEACEFYPMC